MSTRGCARLTKAFSTRIEQQAAPVALHFGTA
jgi:hypothetical protein